MKLAIILVLSLSTAYAAPANKKKPTQIASKIPTSRVLSPLPKNLSTTNDRKLLQIPEVDRWKQILLDRSQKISLQIKMRALVRLSEMEQNEITDFLASRRTQLDSDIRSGVILFSRDVESYRKALSRILATRTSAEIADRDSR